MPGQYGPIYRATLSRRVAVHCRPPLIAQNRSPIPLEVLGNIQDVDFYVVVNDSRQDLAGEFRSLARDSVQVLHNQDGGPQ